MLNFRLLWKGCFFVMVVMLSILSVAAQSDCSRANCDESEAISQRATPTAVPDSEDESDEVFPDLTGGKWTAYPLSDQSAGALGVEDIQDVSEDAPFTFTVMARKNRIMIHGLVALLPKFMNDYDIVDNLELIAEDENFYRGSVNTYTPQDGGYYFEVRFTRISPSTFKALVHVSFFELLLATDFLIVTDDSSEDPRTEMTRCEGAPLPRLIPGETGVVLEGLGYNNMRSAAGLSATKIASIGGEFLVLSGPVCKDGFAWWEVEYQGQTGWTVEGEDDMYWVWEEGIYQRDRDIDIESP